MSEIKTTRELHDKINHAQTFEELRATCINAGVESGLLAKNVNGVLELRAPTAPDKRNDKGEFERVVYANGHYLSLTASTSEQLDVLQGLLRRR
jgi:hypothetical protein